MGMGVATGRGGPRAIVGLEGGSASPHDLVDEEKVAGDDMARGEELSDDTVVVPDAL